MRLVATAALVVAIALPGPASSHRGPPARAQPKPPPAQLCLGAYADDLGLQSALSRKLEQSARYTYCVRTTAVYQCLSYDREGNVKKRRETVVAHGTAFGLRSVPGYTYLVTNEHVSEWPLVTETATDDVPAGCKRMSSTITIVDDDKDAYDADDIHLSRVVVDPELDVTVLRAPAKLAILPFKLGQSAALVAGNAVQVRGFPLGAFAALNLGKVTSTRDRDTEKRWDHDDFVIDALLSQGNSGSPVLAVNCRTRELELVGIYHAGYKLANALNVVVHIDDMRDLLTTLKPRKKRPDGPRELSRSERAQLVAQVSSKETLTQMPFGGLVMSVRLGHEGALVYEVFDREYPLSDRRIAIFEDLPSERGGRVGRIWWGGKHGIEAYAFAELERPDQVLVERAVTSLRLNVVRVLQHRAVEQAAGRSRQGYDRLRALERQTARTEAIRRDLVRGLLDAASRYSPDEPTEADPLAQTFEPPRRPPVADRRVPEPPKKAHEPARAPPEPPKAQPAPAGNPDVRPASEKARTPR